MLAPEPQRARSLLPRAALVALLLVSVLASRRGGAGAAAGPAARQGAPDIKDTHRRLEQIYQRLGIKRDEEPVPEQQGCGCRRAQPEPTPSPPLRGPALRPPAMPPFLGYLLIAAVILAMLIPLYLSLRASYRRSAGEVGAEAGEEDEESGQPAEQARGPWLVDLAGARALLEAGRLAEAFAALHRAFLLGLAGQRLLLLDPRTTNWEYVRRLSSRPELRQTLAAVTVAAEASVLGRRPPGRDHFFALEERVLAATREAAS